MKILFEGHKYPSDILKPFIKGLKLDNIKVKNNVASLSYVGYYYCNTEEINDIVFVLPKVFVYDKDSNITEPDEEEDADNEEIIEKDSNKNKPNYLAFGEYRPEDIINADKTVFSKDKENGAYLHEYIFNLSAWLYQTLQRYDKRIPDNKDCVRNVGHHTLAKKGAKHGSTLMDRIFALKKFAEKNQSFFMFVLQASRTGFNKVNWRKTINKELPFIVNNEPIYTTVSNKRRTVNFEEELLVILFSTLADIHKTYGIYVNINEQFELMNPRELKIFKASACKKLKSIKYRYFSDKSLELWTLLYNYYDKLSAISTGEKEQDMLLVKSFNPVFEDMIDYLLSDENHIPKELKIQKDGKLVDHIYRDKSLTYDEEVFYIGDSKYYKEGREIEDKSIAKQYTYAKNIIQRNIDVLRGFDSHFKDPIKNKYKEQKKDYLEYRDDLTEGYNISPNFFISGRLYTNGYKFEDKKDNLTPDNNKNNRSQQFENRLFDRDTLILQRYNINFLFVLMIYARNSTLKKLMFRANARARFKEDLQKKLDDNYYFYHFTELTNTDKIDSFLNANFRKVNGKVYSYKRDDDSIYLLMALEQSYCTVQSESENDINQQYQTTSQMLKNKIRVENGKTIGLDKPYDVEQVWLTPDAKNAAITANTIGTVSVNTTEAITSVETEEQWHILAEIDENLKYNMYLPLYTIKAACGRLNNNTESDCLGWIKVEGIGTLNDKMFIVQAKGDSMEPYINDGDYCVFDGNIGGTKSGNCTVLAFVNERGYNEDERYVIKDYESRKELNPETNNYEIVEIILKSRNKVYDDIILKNDEDLYEAIKGIFKGVLKPK